MAMYYNGKKVRNLYYNGKCITRLALGKEMTRLVEGDDFVMAEWLRAEIPPQSVLMTIEIGDVFNYSRVYESIGNSSHLLTNGYNYYSSSPVMTSIGVWNGSQNVENKAVNFTNGLNVVCTQDKLTFNSVEFPKYGFPASLRWNNSASMGGANTVVKTSSIYVDGVERYIPCRLLRPIPAALDANGIARNAGECGMYDSVSGKFYGNVASSGTFTVEPSLVEGVDYERHEWLVGDGSAYIDTLITSYAGLVKIGFDVRNSIGTRIIGRERSDTSQPDYSERFVVQYQSDGYLWMYGANAVKLLSDKKNEITIDIANDIVVGKDGASVQGIGVVANKTGMSLYLFADHRTYGATDFYSGAISKFEISSIIDLVPVRLLRPLPSYLDANGKNRKQFECGMLDLKTMTFYGNVATTGKFTVSDN